MNTLLKLAIARFAVKHGRKAWKTELRKCWSRSSYPGMGSDDSSYLQMARNSGVDLDKLTFDELNSELSNFRYEPGHLYELRDGDYIHCYSCNPSLTKSQAISAYQA